MENIIKLNFLNNKKTYLKGDFVPFKSHQILLIILIEISSFYFDFNQGLKKEE